MEKAKQPQPTATERLAKWGITVEHALFSSKGNWYHVLRKFPGAYLDPDGYVIFETVAEYRGYPGLTFGRDRGGVGISRGIRSLPDYVPMAAAETPEVMAVGRTKP
jgi:hypothetical protein